MTHTHFKILIAIFMALILYNLFRGLYFLVTGKQQGKGTARALSWRIGLSVLLFLVLIALKLSGLVEPHALNEKPKAALIDEAITNEAADKTTNKDEGKTLEEIQQQNNDGRIRLKP